MSDTATAPEVRAAKRRQLIGLLVAVVVVLGVLYGAIALFARAGHHGGAADLKPMAAGGMHNMTVLATPGPAPATPVTGPDGKSVALADLKGKVVILNLWATWCAPCRKEMPTLAGLQSAYAGKPLAIMAVSTDGDADMGKARAFIGNNKPLAFYHVATDWVFHLAPPARGLPTTLILDKSGRERARVTGEADWTSGEARKVVDALLNEGA